MFDRRHLGFFLGGFLCGTAGVKLLSSRDAKKTYTHIVAAGLRIKNDIAKNCTSLRENLTDIIEEAHDINDKREAKEETIYDDTADGSNH